MLDPVTPWKNVSKRQTRTDWVGGELMVNKENIDPSARLQQVDLHQQQRPQKTKSILLILLVSSHISQCIALSIWKIYRGGSLSTVPRFGTSEPVIFNRKSVVDRMKSALP